MQSQLRAHHNELAIIILKPEPCANSHFLLRNIFPSQCLFFIKTFSVLSGRPCCDIAVCTNQCNAHPLPFLNTFCKKKWFRAYSPLLLLLTQWVCNQKRICG